MWRMGVLGFSLHVACVSCASGRLALGPSTVTTRTSGGSHSFVHVEKEAAGDPAWTAANVESDSVLWAKGTMIYEFVHNWMKHVVSNWPNHALLGFALSCGAAIVALPLLLICSLIAIWSLAAVGPARKTFSSIFIVIFGVPIYPIICLLLFVIFWFVVAAGAIAFSVVVPLASLFFIFLSVCTATAQFVDEQRRQSPVVDDITFLGLFVGLIIGVLSICSFGILAVVLTLVKGPLVLVCCTAYAARKSFPWVLEAGCFCPLALVCWLFAFVIGIIVLAFGILLSAVVKLLLSAIWPGYVAAGWLRHFGGGGRRTDVSCCTPFLQGFKAAYQVVWAADLLTNACIFMDFELLEQTRKEFMEIASGQRDTLSPECRKISCLPPVVVGLYQGSSWDMAEQLIAKQLGVKQNVVQESWQSLANQMTQIGREGLATGLLTEEYVLCVPPSLVVGLPARVLLDTVERSPGASIELASGLTLTEYKRPQGQFADMVWNQLKQAKAALPRMSQTGSDGRQCLCGLLLAGGGDPDSDELPSGLVECVRRLDELPETTRESILAVQRPLIAISVECTRQKMFTEKLKEVIKALSDEEDERVPFAGHDQYSSH